jgi:nucleotide-binding universal stress UspA family protein
MAFAGQASVPEKPAGRLTRVNRRGRAGIDSGQHVRQNAAYFDANRTQGTKPGGGMISDVLVYANSFETWSPAVEYAARLAAGEAANLTAAYVYPTPAFMMPAHATPALLSAIVENTRRIERESLATEGRFVAWAREQGVVHANWQVAEGYLPAALTHLGNWHDLLVLGRDGEVPWESAADLGALVVQCGLACVIVPEDRSAAVQPECIALGWNGAPEGLRAIHAARPLLSKARRVVLLNGRRRDPLGEIGWRPEFDIHAYLGRHGIKAEDTFISAGDADAGDALLDAAARVDAGLLVMGAYGRNRFSEWIFGGATRRVLERATLPVLMRH